LTRARKTEFIMKVWQNNLAEVFEQRYWQYAWWINTGRDTGGALAQHLAGTLMT